MKSVRTVLFVLLAAYAVSLAVNIAANYQYYAAGNDWRHSVGFTLCITTVGVLGGTTILPWIFSKFRWNERPTLKILLSVLIYGLYGVVLMAGSILFMIRVLGYGAVSRQEFVSETIYSVLFTMIIGLLVSGREFLLHLKKSVEDNERMKQEMIQSQYATLKSQVNPHFLFNSLNTLAGIIPSQPDIAVRFVEQLSKVFRYSLEHGAANTIAVATELRVVRSYLFLNEQRYDGKLRVSIDLSEDAMQRQIITQSLLMLAENAIKHNEISTQNPLTLRISDEGDYLVVSNTLQRRALPEPSTGMGLENIRRRYELATAMPVVVEEAGGNFVVKIPLLHAGDRH